MILLEERIWDERQATVWKERWETRGGKYLEMLPIFNSTLMWQHHAVNTNFMSNILQQGKFCNIHFWGYIFNKQLLNIAIFDTDKRINRDVCVCCTYNYHCKHNRAGTLEQQFTKYYQ